MSIISKPKFLRIPSSIIRRSKDMGDQITLVNQNTLIPEILIRLQLQMNIEDECLFSIDNLITKCGYTPQAGKGRSIESFRHALQLIQDYGFIYNISFGEGVNFSNVRTSTLLTCRYNEKLEVNDKEEFVNYYTIDINDYALMSRNASGTFLRNMINVYCCLSSKKLLKVNSSSYSDDNTQRKEDIRPKIEELNFLKVIGDSQYIDEEDFSKSEFHRFGYAFATYEQICKEVSESSSKLLSKPTLANVLNKLVELGILYYGNIHDYIPINTVKKPCNIYAFTAHGFYKGLKFSFSKQQSKNKNLYTEPLRKQLIKTVVESLKRNEHHINSKELD